MRTRRFFAEAGVNGWRWSLLLVAVLGLVFQSGAPAADPQDDAGDKAWQELEKALRPPEPPAEWRVTQPSQEEIAKFRAQHRAFAEKGADKAKDFYTRFPKHPKEIEARRAEYDLLSRAVMLGSTDKLPRVQTAAKELLKQPGLSEDERFEIRGSEIQLAAMGRPEKDRALATAEFEKDVRALQKEFPNRPEVWQMLVEVASDYEGEKARPLLKEIIDGSAPNEVKEEAKGMLKKLDLLGKPVAIKFTAVDGREVDLAKLKGKVVLIDFWATWCGPCVAEVPNVVKAYEKLHAKGFEIVGISFDREGDKARLEKFVADKKMPWPQYFDGKFWQNKFGQEFAIHSIPTMWLVDKKGNLRDLNARGDVEAKVEKLLAE